MAGLVDYVVWRGDVSLENSPFNVVDALVFSQITYLNLKDFVSESFLDSVELSKMSPIINDKKSVRKLKKHLGPYISPDTYTLLKLCSESKRYGSLKIGGFREVFDKKKCEQFAAFTVSGKNFNCVCYRGTDESIMGWQEDFALSYSDFIPSQIDALEYLKDAMVSLKGKFILSGHSKGGNIAMYSAINGSDKMKKRISNVFNFDGPGFSKEILKSENYQKVSEKIYSVYPECSIVGMFFYHSDKFEIAESSERIVMQHDPFSWSVTPFGFVNKKNFDDESVFFYKTFNKWYAELSLDEIKNVTEKMFGIIYKSGIETLSDMENDKLHNSAKILNELMKIDFKERHEVLKLVSLFLKAGKGNFPLFESFKPSFSSITDLFSEHK